MARTALQWARALLDCGVLRVSFDDDVLICGIESGSICFRPDENDEDAIIVWLSDKGKAEVANWPTHG